MHRQHMQDPCPNQEQIHSQNLLDYKTGIEEEDKGSSRGRSSRSQGQQEPYLATVQDLPSWSPAPTSAPLLPHSRAGQGFAAGSTNPS